MTVAGARIEPPGRASCRHERAAHGETAAGIGFSRSAVSREISRYRDEDGTYDPYRAQMAALVPDALMRSITWDQDAEIAGHAAFTAKTGIRIYFCDPHSPWQHGANENTSGLIRDYFPKGTDFTKVTDGRVGEIQDQLNGRPGEALGWKTPAEAYHSLSENAT